MLPRSALDRFLTLGAWLCLTLGAACTNTAGDAAPGPVPSPQAPSASAPAQQEPEPEPEPTLEPAPDPGAAWNAGRRAARAGDLAAAARNYDVACGSGHARACLALAKLLDDGRGVKADPDRARGLFQQACAENLQEACDALGH